MALDPDDELCVNCDTHPHDDHLKWCPDRYKDKLQKLDCSCGGAKKHAMSCTFWNSYSGTCNCGGLHTYECSVYNVKAEEVARYKTYNSNFTVLMGYFSNEATTYFNAIFRDTVFHYHRVEADQDIRTRTSADRLGQWVTSLRSKLSENKPKFDMPGLVNITNWLTDTQSWSSPGFLKENKILDIDLKTLAITWYYHKEKIGSNQVCDTGIKLGGSERVYTTSDLNISTTTLTESGEEVPEEIKDINNILLEMRKGISETTKLVNNAIVINNNSDKLGSKLVEVTEMIQD